MKRHGHRFPTITSWTNLLAAAASARRGKRLRPATAAFHVAQEPELPAIQSALKSLTWQPGPYRTFRIPDPKPRLISAAPYRDRVVHHAFCRLVEPVFERVFIHDSYACRRGKGTHAALERAASWTRRFPWVLKCDVRNFFPSLDHAVLMGVMSANPHSHETSHR